MNNNIPPTGSLNAQIILITDTPTSEELSLGKLFVGQTGDKLDSLLASTGLSRTNLRITSLIKEQPIHSDPASYIKWGPFGPEPTTEFDTWKTLLLEELSSLPNAKVLVPLGNLALFALTNQWGISQRRGSLWPTPFLPNATVLPTLHPASALRNKNPINHFIIQMDLMKVNALAAGTLADKPEPVLLLDPPFQEVLSFLDRCLQAPEVGIDIETSTQRIKNSRYTREMTMFSIALAEESMAVPLALPNGNEPRWTPEEEDAILMALFRVMEAEGVMKIGQNLSFDASFFYHRYGVPVWPFQDTMMASRIVCPDLEANLGFLCSIHTLHPYYKDLAGSGDWQSFLRYSAMDSAVVLEIWPRVERDLRQQGNWDTYVSSRDSFQPALFIQEHGLLLDKPAQQALRKTVLEEMDILQTLVDQDYLTIKKQDPVWVASLEKAKEEAELPRLKAVQKIREARTHLEEVQEAFQSIIGTGTPKQVEGAKKRVEKAQAALEKVLGSVPKTKGKDEKLAALQTLNVQSPPQLVNFFYGKKPSGLGYPPLLSDGKPTVDDKARKRLIGKGCEMAKTIDRLIQCANDLGKYWEATTDPDSYARCSIDVTGTDSLRWASKVSMFGTGFQFFNTPKRFRPLLIAEKNRPFIQMDEGQAENRIVAVLANDTRMMEAFEKGLDVHRLTAGLMFGIRPEDISDKPGSSQLGDGKHSQRDWGKKANHAFNYGLGPSGAVEQLEVPAADAKFLYNAYHRAYPGVRNTFWATVKETIYKTRYLENLLGQRRLYLTPLSGDNERAAYSFIPQSTVPRLLRDWVMLPVYREADPAVSLVNHVYDSLEYQYDLSREGLLGMANFMLSLREQAEKPLHYKGKTFTIPADFKVGWSLGKMTEIKERNPQRLAEELETILYGQGAV